MIDFSTLQGLTIPEGVVTQITDASGRVIWSAVRSVIGTLYLRPSADISIVSGNKYPETFEYCYQAISEEVADGYATYFGDEDSRSASGSGSIEANVCVDGTFMLSLNKNVSISKIISAEYVLVANTTSSEDSFLVSGVTSYVTVAGVEYSFKDDGAPSNTLNQVVENINHYLASNGVLPEITLRLYRTLKEKIDTPSSKDTVSASVKIDQAYIALECEYIE